MESQGANICGPFGSVGPALLVAAELPFKAAVLDLDPCRPAGDSAHPARVARQKRHRAYTGSARALIETVC